MTPRPINHMNQQVPLPDQDETLKTLRSFPKTVVWEEDLQMSSKFLDIKVTNNICIYIYIYIYFIFTSFTYSILSQYLYLAMSPLNKTLNLCFSLKRRS